MDLSKSYDRVDWNFFRQVMQKMGFSHRWIDWIMTCVISVRYTIKLNGSSLDSFAPSRGLRQGDPLSPFLFLFVAEGLSTLLENYESVIRDFCWGDKDEQRKIHWMSWENMTSPKRDGGIGFRDMHLFNQALLARQG